MKNPPPPFASGLSCLRFGMSPGISEAELLGMGFGESVGGRDARDDEDRARDGGSGKRLSVDGAKPEIEYLSTTDCSPISQSPVNASHSHGSS